MKKDGEGKEVAVALKAPQPLNYPAIESFYEEIEIYTKLRLE